MKIEINENGRLRLIAVGDGAWQYIQTQRMFAGDPEHWQFGRERYDGIVYITTTDYEDKTEIIRIIDGLKEMYAIDISPQANRLLSAWRNDAQRSREAAESTFQFEIMERHIRALQNVLKRGCKACGCFHEELRGDDAVGICVLNGEAYELESSPVRPEHGEWKIGEHYWGRKYYPCTKCKYLSEEVK